MENDLEELETQTSAKAETDDMLEDTILWFLSAAFLQVAEIAGNTNCKKVEQENLNGIEKN